jgi:high-affinity iron transporter
MLKSTFNIRRFTGLLLLGLALGVALFFSWRLPHGAVAEPGASGDAQRLVSILQYLESDYPAAVASEDAGELSEQRSLSTEAVAEVGRLPAASGFAARVASIDTRVRAAQDPGGVSAECASLVDDLVAATGIARAPSGVPDIDRGSRLFAESCATCHGATGHGDGPAAAALKPRPADFHSDEVMEALTPFKAFNVIRFGVQGTAMAPNAGLDDKQRWALAFYLFTLRQPPCDHVPPRTSLDELANRSDGELAKSIGPGDVACLRRSLPELDARALVGAARSRVDEAMHLADRGDFRAAENAVLDAYLTDVEPIEPWLRARDADLVTRLEASFTTTRAALQQRDPTAHEEAVRLLGLLDSATGPHARSTAASVFGFSLLVVVREGFEAAVIIAALLAVVKKRKQLARARLVHAGWLSALAVGAVLFVVGRSILAGAMNEKLEGFLALVAAAMLLHAALWLNARSTTRRTMGELRDRTQGALDSGGMALFGIAFLAMFRETFETAVFLEALSIDAPSAVVWGSLAGTVLLLGLVLAVSRLGLRLPMTTLFKVSTVVLVGTAVVLLGEGIHSLQEVGLVPSRPMPFLRIEFLGIFPDRIGLLVQLAVAVAPLIWRAQGARASRESTLDTVTKPGQ